MPVTFNEKFIAYLALISGLLISGVAEYYSIVGFTAIFAAAVIPVIIMGIALGVGKITATVWLKQNWNIAPWSVRIYLLAAIFVLMCVTSLGIFGFLSKAHSDQSLVSGDVLAKIAIYDEKIQTERDNIDAARKALAQMDAQVNERLSRSTDDRGAERAVQIRRQQQAERTRLQTDISRSQSAIAKLNEEAAPIRAEVRKVEAEVGPIKYIAAFIYEDNPDTNLLERAVTWVIILLIIVFDPLAVILLLASQISFQNFRERKIEPKPFDFGPTEYIPDPEEEAFYNKSVPYANEKPTAEELAEGDSPEKESDVVSTATVTESILAQHPYLTQGFSHFENLKPMVYKPDEPKYQILPELQTELDKQEEPLFVQNEEQTQSDLWSKTATAITQDEYQETALSRQEKIISDWVSRVKRKEISMSDVPEHLLLEVRARI